MGTSRRGASQVALQRVSLDRPDSVIGFGDLHLETGIGPSFYREFVEIAEYCFDHRSAYPG